MTPTLESHEIYSDETYRTWAKLLGYDDAYFATFGVPMPYYEMLEAGVIPNHAKAYAAYLRTILDANARRNESPSDSSLIMRAIRAAEAGDCNEAMSLWKRAILEESSLQSASITGFDVEAS